MLLARSLEVILYGVQILGRFFLIDQVLENHLLGREVFGIYLLRSEVFERYLRFVTNIFYGGPGF